ncbi:MAG: Ribosomal large subunit methyltransferase [Candidatus Parcubacteria bacterium]|jgi:23S rRNA (cytosine1962-C5)-methyltransferase
MSSFIIKTLNNPDLQYHLIDSGDGRKLESYNGYIMDRPDPQALWPQKMPASEWKKAGAVFIEKPTGKREERGDWKVIKPLPEDFSIQFFGNLKAQIKLSPFKHTGIFPEQFSNWEFINTKLKNTTGKKVLNLFGYTGCASLVAAEAGAEVVHVDGSKSSIATGMANAKLSGLGEAPIRWILDDAFAFVKREIRRGNLYDGIIMDPPSFGRGAKGEIWKLEDSFVAFVAECAKLLKPNALFFIVNGYAAGYSHIAYKQNLDMLLDAKGTESGELLIEDSQGRFLPGGIVARWSN